jgi:hypothetical protein
MPFQCQHCAYSYQTMGQWTRHLSHIHQISTISEPITFDHSHPRSEAHLSFDQPGGEGIFMDHSM